MTHSNNKFIFLMAFLTSLVALSIDAMLPALESIQESLNITRGNDIQKVISFVFLGMSLGLMVYGPLSDSFGRKKSLYLGISIFIIGSCVSFFSKSLAIMLAGRLLQGMGAASCRVVGLAMIRDQFSGREMARVFSLISVVFITVPVLAPILGLTILSFSGWRSIFIFFIALGGLAITLLYFGQKETLPPEKRSPFTFNGVVNGILETVKNPVARCFTISSGLITGSFIGYLSSSQQILEIHYQLGDFFSFYFSGLALFIGLSSFLNSKFVKKIGMVRLSILSIATILTLSLSHLFLLYIYNGQTPLFIFLLYLGLLFLCIGFSFGNLNAIAIDSLGHIAGVANSVISSIQTLISVLVGAYIGHLYNDSTYPLTIGFITTSLFSSILITTFQKSKYAYSSDAEAAKVEV